MSNQGPAVVRLAHPLAFSAYLRHIGASPEGYFRRHKLPSYCQDPGAIVPLLSAWELFADAAQREDRFIGWHAGRYVGDIGLSGVLLKKLEQAPTLYQALKLFNKLVASEASHIKIGMLERRHHVLLYTDYPGAHGEPGFLVSQAYEICALLDLVRHFAGADWKPRELGIIDSEVPPPLMQRFPEASIRVNQPFGFIVISRSCLHKKLCRPHRIDRDDGPLIDTAILDCAEMLALLLEPHLSEGYPNMDFAAELVNTSARTLNRRLLECNTNYQALVDELRLRKAMAMLQSTQMPINEVSWSVGFRQPPNFTRMFRRMTGINPRQFRRFEAQKLH